MQFTIAQSPSPSPTTVDIPLPTGTNSIWVLAAAIISAIATKIWPDVWGHFKKKDENEDKITSTLVDNLLKNNEQLLQGNLAGFRALEEGQRNVEKAIVELGKTIQLEVQTTLKQQGIGYANVAQVQTEHIYLLKALHERFDNHELVLQVLADKMGLTTKGSKNERHKTVATSPAKS